MSWAIPRSGEKGSTLQVLPVDSKINAYLPNTTIFVWLSNSEVEFSLLCEFSKEEIIAFNADLVDMHLHHTLCWLHLYYAQHDLCLLPMKSVISFLFSK